MWFSLRSLRQLVMGSAGAGSFLIAGLPAAWADCPNCQPGANSQAIHSPGDPQPGFHQPVESYPHPEDADYARESQHSPAGPMYSEQIVKPGYAVLPPPGTLGETYHRKSWLIPRDEHPRTAMIQITAPGFTEMEIEGLEEMEGFQREDGVWIFKSKYGLTPGIAHIYNVKAGHTKGRWERKNVRTVRLIAGRVVTLEY